MHQIARLTDGYISLPGLATAHSHAFQRALRARTQRPDTSAPDFWSWRQLMYKLASRLDPDSMYKIAHFAYSELALSGVTAVGEFHYLHHDPHGRPYAERTVMADAVIRAARDVGLRICLLRVLYQRDHWDTPLHGVQQRFGDADLDDGLEDVLTLINRYQNEPSVTVGVAPHSIRAVSKAWLEHTTRFASERNVPLHMHVAEQEQDVDQCLAEHGKRPVELLEALGALSPRFVAVHATHVSEAEITMLAQAKALVCICRTTERDLGDGLPASSAMTKAGVRLCFGVDSHAISDPFEEARSVELDERSRLRCRHAVLSATELLRASSVHGYAAIGFDGKSQEDGVVLRMDDPALGGASAELLDEAVVYGANTRCVEQIHVGGQVLNLPAVPFPDDLLA